MGRRKAALRYTKEYLEPLVRQAETFADLCRHLRIKHGGGQSYVKQRIREYGIDMSHFKSGYSWAKGIPNSSARRKPETVFVILAQDSHRIHGYMLYRTLVESGVPECCAICRLKPVWEQKKLVLIVDHINGDWRNNLKENLRLLCPNCDSQTDTYKSKNKFGRLGECGNTSSPENCRGLIT